jgi:Short C-terminal domain
VPIDTVQSIEITGREVRISKVGPVLVFGLMGLAARGSKMQTTLVVRTKDGETLYFSLDRQAPEQVKALLTPHLKLVGVPFYGDSPPPSAGGPDLADQIRKLAALRDDGLLTQEEFEAQKAKLLR